MITRTVKLPKELDARLRRRARTLKLSYSEAARQALRDGLREESGVNMLAALEEFAGVVEGPADLATNRDHLADFGERKPRR
jgi:predicted transcriptional regulator